MPTIGILCSESRCCRYILGGYASRSGVSNGRYQNAFLFVFLAILFGSSFAAIKAGLAALPPILFAALRFDIAAPLILVYAAWRYDVWIPQTRADYASLTVSAVTIIAANNGLLFIGQQTITPAAASVMYGLNPILAPIFAVVLLDQHLDIRDSAGILLGLAGVIVIVQPTPAMFTSGSTIGKLLVLGAAAMIALGSVTMRRLSATLDSIALTGWSMALGAVLLHLWSLAAGESLSGLVLSTRVLVALAVVGVASTAVAYPIYFLLNRRIGPVRTNLIAYVVPVVAALIGWVFLSEPVTVSTAVGFAIVLAGVGLLERRVIAAELRRMTG